MSNKIYYIYEIQGVKIGCTVNVAHRMQEQGYQASDAIILEEHTCIYTVSDREIELQKENNYPVDKIPYWQAVQNRKPSFEDSSKGGLGNKGVSKSISHRNNISKAKSKLDIKIVREIRSEWKGPSPNQYQKVGPTIKELSKKYNTTRSIVSGIVNNLTYKEA